MRETQPDIFNYSINAAAIALGVSRSTIYRLIREEKIETFKINARTFISRDEMENFILRQSGSDFRAGSFFVFDLGAKLVGTHTDIESARAELQDYPLGYILYGERKKSKHEVSRDDN